MSEAFGAKRVCPACGSARRAAWRLASPSPGVATTEPVAVDRCADCGTAWVRHPPSDGERRRLHAATPRVPATGAAALVVRPLRWLSLRDRLRLLPPLPAGARIFDVGAGDGSFVAALARRGYEVRGTDPYRRSSAGPHLMRASVEGLSLPPASQDVTILWHVLEHLPAPLEALRRIGQWTAPGGIVLVAVPNAGSLQARLGGDRWFQQDVPRHVVHFTRDGLAALLARAGLDVRRSRLLVLDQSVLAMWQTLLNRLTIERDVALGLLRRRLPHARRSAAAFDVAVSAVAGSLFVPVAVAAEVAAGAVGAGGSIVVEASVRHAS